tara:strand:+ start:724 stop:966 length:243 start_codon:yes stop_codon:yes gene_type:complete
MLHTIEDLIRRINVMKDKSTELHRVRNEVSAISGKTYNKGKAKEILADIQALALSIAMDREDPEEIKTEMEYKTGGEHER